MKRLEKRIPLATPTMHGNEIEYVNEAFEKNWIAPLGFNCDNFEIEMGEYLNKGLDTKYHSLALSSGTAALHLATKLAGLKRGDTVFCTDMTFAATVNPVSYEGGKQVFIDTERDTWNMDPNALELAFKKYPDTRLVVMAHLYGTPGKMDELLEICNRHGAIMIEDAAESLSATYKGRQTGTFGKYNAISFNGNKIITTSGGGMLLTDSEEARKKAFFWATQSRENAPWYQHEETGYNYRMSNVVAGIGRGQLKHIDDHRARKEAIYKRYEKELANLPITMNPYLDYTKPNFWLSCMLIDKSCKVQFMDVINKLSDLNIETRPIWKPMSLQPVFKGHDLIKVENESVGADIFSRGLCLPSDIKMTVEEQMLVIQAIKECF